MTGTVTNMTRTERMLVAMLALFAGSLSLYAIIKFALALKTRLP